VAAAASPPPAGPPTQPMRKGARPPCDLY
jgi:hypothetical protein